MEQAYLTLTGREIIEEKEDDMKFAKTAGAKADTWSRLMEQIEVEYDIVVDSAYRQYPEQRIYGYNDGEEYEIEVARYFNGDYEVIGVAKTGGKSAMKIAKTQKYAMSVSDLIIDLRGALEDEGPFDNTDEAYEMLMEQLDSSFIYTSDIFDLAKIYVNDSEILGMFYEELLNDIMSEIDLDDYVKEEEDEDEEDY